MLVLSRRLNEKVLFPDIQAAVRVVAIKAGTVRLGIEAPDEVTVLREELRDRVAQWGKALKVPAREGRLRQVNQMLRKRLQVAQTGLQVLGRQLRSGLPRDAETTLELLEEDLEMLWQRLDAEEVRELPPPPAPAPRRATALLVEDNANERELLATFLRLSGLEVVTAGDGEDALKYLHSHRLPDLVLLDMGLPRCDGATVVRALRGDPECARLKIFAVSGHVPEEYDLASGPGGVNRWFHKPIDPAEFVRDLNQELNGALYQA